MFNYFHRIALLAKEYEQDGKFDKSERLRSILKNEKRCVSCGAELIYDDCNNCLHCKLSYKK